MAIVIRTAYNNQDWKAPCKTPGEDRLCRECFKEILGIDAPKKDDVTCSGHCWEQHLCNDYKWGCTPKGRVYGSRANPGTTVFFVFKQPDGNYTIWGKTTVSSVDEVPMQSDKDYEDGFAFIHFEPFDPLPRDKWVKDIPVKQLVGAQWLMGRHRFLGADKEKYLDRLIEGEATVESIEPMAVKTGIGKSDGVVLGTTVTQSIYKKLEEAAAEEGRSIDELVREAVAAWLKGR